MMRYSPEIETYKDTRVTSMKKLDAEEKEILDAFEAGTLKRAANAKEEIKRHREYAAAMLKNNSRKNARASSSGLQS